MSPDSEGGLGRQLTAMSTRIIAASARKGRRLRVVVPRETLLHQMTRWPTLSRHRTIPLRGMTRLYHRAGLLVIANFQCPICVCLVVTCPTERLVLRNLNFGTPLGTSRQDRRISDILVVLFSRGNALPDTEAVKDVQLCSVP
jgi:hypothetical protein